MDPLSIANRYFEAWNARDPELIMAAFADGGTYSDPLTGGLLTGAQIGEYARGLFTSFPDLRFEIASEGEAGDSSISAQWIMRGTNTGSMMGLPPTGKSVELYGADFITVDGDKIRSVTGYFDSAVVPKQLGLQVIVQPESNGPVKFGYSTYMNVGKHSRAGAISVTALQVRSAEEQEEALSYSRRVVSEMAQMPGFISFLGAVVGERMVTVSVWEDEEAPRALMREGTHKEAVQRFFGPEFTLGGITSVMTPGRVNVQWARCEACGKMADSQKLEGLCACGARLPSLIYW